MQKIMKKNQQVGVLYAVIAVLLFSSKAVVVKLSYAEGVDTITALMLRMGFSLPIFLVVGFFKSEKGKEKLTLTNSLWIIGLGVLGYYAASYFDFKGLTYLDASLERLILFIYPTIVVILSAVVFRKKIGLTQGIAIMISYVGLAVIFLPDLLQKETNFNYLGVTLILLSAFTYASYLVASQHFIPKIGTTRFTTLAMVVSCFCVIIHYLIVSDLSIFQLDTNLYLFGIYMAVIATVIPAYLVSSAIEKIGSSRLAIIGCLGPVSTITLSVFFLGEEITLNQMIGGIIIIAGVVWINLQKAKKT